MNDKKNYFNILAIILLAGVARYFFATHMGALYWDELFSTIYSRFPWGASWHYWIWETNPPLHLLLLKFWFYIFPVTEIWARLPSVIIGALSVGAIFILAKDWFGARAGYLAAILLAISPYHIFISSLGRGYALLVLLAILSIYYFAKIFFQENTLRSIYWLGALCHLLLMYTHLTGVGVIIAELLILFLLRPKSIKRWIIWGLPAAALWLIWAIPAIMLKFNADTVGRGWFFNIPNTWDVALSAVQPLLVGSITIPFLALAAQKPWALLIWTASLAWFGLLLAYFTAVTFRNQAKARNINEHFLLTAILVWLPIFSAATLHLWHSKFFTISLPFLIILMVYFENKYNNISTRIILIIMIGFNMMGALLAIKTMPVNDWSGVNKFITEHTIANKKQVLIYNTFVDRLFLGKYIHTTLPIIPYSDPEDANIPFNDLVVRKNYWRFTHDSAALQTWFDKNSLNAYEQILLLSEDGTGINLAKILTTSGWILDSRVRSNTGDPRSISLYVHNPTTTTKK